MSKRRRRNARSKKARSSGERRREKVADTFRNRYSKAQSIALAEKWDRAQLSYSELLEEKPSSRDAALVENDLGVLAVLAGHDERGKVLFRQALDHWGDCHVACENLLELEGRSTAVPKDTDPATNTVPSSKVPQAFAQEAPRARVAILSFLFNWPSTGGGTIHTWELAKFLGSAGYEVQHIFAQNPSWNVGCIKDTLPYDNVPLQFDDHWSLPEIQDRFRAAVDAFAPDYVIITDSWNIKPLLAEACRGYPFLLRLQALECLCPLNNLRLLTETNGDFSQCPRHQLASPETCSQCLAERQHLSGGLHQAERSLCGVGSAEYTKSLHWAFEEAEAVLVVNPQTEAMVSPFCKKVVVAPSGFDVERFPWPWPEGEGLSRDKQKLVIFMAGLVHEGIKGFHVLHAAGELLWKQRQDFEIVVTGEPAGQVDEFTRFVGWQSQENLPDHLRAADVLAFPTIAQEALGRTAVEAMAVGRPIVASRLGGLPDTIGDGAGLCFEAGNAADLAAKLEFLLDRPQLREQMGQLGRLRFETHFTWDAIIERCYKPLLGRSAVRHRK